MLIAAITIAFISGMIAASLRLWLRCLPLATERLLFRFASGIIVCTFQSRRTARRFCRAEN